VDRDPQDTKDGILNTKYDDGVERFNRGEYFEAHEVWEELWMECPSAERRFIQALIQAAVALHHFERGNHAGAARLFNSGRAYMAPFRPVHRGLEVEAFWRQMESHLAPALPASAGPSGPRPLINLAHRPVREAGDD
jgi:predicted metal-dependent hydrolase